jgi:hypothetical protein
MPDDKFLCSNQGYAVLTIYMEQKMFLPCGPEFFAEFSAPPEFSGTSQRPSDIQL